METGGITGLDLEFRLDRGIVPQKIILGVIPCSRFQWMGDVACERLCAELTLHQPTGSGQKRKNHRQTHGKPHRPAYAAFRGIHKGDSYGKEGVVLSYVRFLLQPGFTRYIADSVILRKYAVQFGAIQEEVINVVPDR